jgi:hypothetical protein
MLRLDGVEASPAQPRNSRLDRRRIIALLFAKDARYDKSIKRRSPVRNLDAQALDAIPAALSIDADDGKHPNFYRYVAGVYVVDFGVP